MVMEFAIVPAYGMAVNRFEEYGVKIQEIINCGGIAEKNPILMQIYADIMAKEIKNSRSSQTCTLGSAFNHNFTEKNLYYRTT